MHFGIAVVRTSRFQVRGVSGKCFSFFLLVMWVLIRSTWQRCFKWVPTCYGGEIRKISIFFHRKKHLVYRFGGLFRWELTRYFVAGLSSSVQLSIQLVIRRWQVQSHWVQQHSFMANDDEIFSTVILSLLLIQEGQLSVSGERFCTSLVNCLKN